MSTATVSTTVTVPEIAETGIEPGRVKYICRCIDRYFEWKNAGNAPAEMDDIDAFLEWDRRENRSAAVDRDREKNYRAGLRLQVMNFFKVYTRVSVSIAGAKYNIATVVSTEADGYQQVSRLDSQQYEAHIDGLVRCWRPQMERARMLRGNRRGIQQRCVRFEEAINRAFEEYERG